MPITDYEQPAGFVEPNPIFFARMASRTNCTLDMLDASGVFDFVPESQDLVPEIRATVNYLEKRSANGLKNWKSYSDSATREDLILAGNYHCSASRTANP